MDYLKRYLFATVGIACLLTSLVISAAKANNAESSMVTSSTAHFNPGKTYLFAPANGTGKVKCKVIAVDGAWLSCEGSNEWVNTNAMMFATDAR